MYVGLDSTHLGYMLLTGYQQEDHLFQSKKEIEERFESEKWQKIANSVELKGGNKYPSAAIQKSSRNLARGMLEVVSLLLSWRNTNELGFCLFGV